MSHLIWIYAVCKSLFLSPTAEKELKELLHIYTTKREAQVGQKSLIWIRLIMICYIVPWQPSWLSDQILFVCVEVLRPSQPNGVMSSVVSLPNHTFTGQA